MTCPSCGSQLDEADAVYCGICGARTRPRRSTLVGSILDERYQIESKIAEGGFGSIYRAIHVASGLDVALKILHAELAADPSLAARFRREAACLERLHDPHTVATYETGAAPDGTLYIAMELLVGESLHDRLSTRGVLGWRNALSIIRDACSSLAEAHELGIVHRDLKPANLMIVSNDVVKVLDFGIARVINNDLDDGIELTRMGQTVGTLEYMAPEQVIGGACDPRSDIYQLGVLAYEMITGRRPFAGANDPTSKITALLTQTPAAPSTMFCAGCLPSEVDKLILRCLEREPEHRFASVHELVDAIEDALLLTEAMHPATTRPVDEEAPTWIAAARSQPSPRTVIGGEAHVARVEPVTMPSFEIPARASTSPPRLATGTSSPVVTEAALANTAISPITRPEMFAIGSTVEPALPEVPQVPAGIAMITPMLRPATVAPPARELSFGARIALWSVALAAGGMAIGAAIASLLG